MPKPPAPTTQTRALRSRRWPASPICGMSRCREYLRTSSGVNGGPISTSGAVRALGAPIGISSGSLDAQHDRGCLDKDRDWHPDDNDAGQLVPCGKPRVLFLGESAHPSNCQFSGLPKVLRSDSLAFRITKA